MSNPWHHNELLQGFLEEKKAQEEMGRLGEIPNRARRAYADLLFEPEVRVPQSLAGVRGMQSSPLRFGAPTDIAPPSGMDSKESGPLDRQSLKATRVGLHALRLTVI